MHARPDRPDDPARPSSTRRAVSHVTGGTADERHYASRYNESPSRKIDLDGQPAKEYWAEGSRRAHNAARYDQGHRADLAFEEGVDGYVPYAGSLHDGVHTTLTKLRATLASCGSANLREFHDNALLAPISPLTSSQSTYDIQVRRLQDDAI